MPLDEEQMIDYMTRKSASIKRWKAEGRYGRLIALRKEKTEAGMDVHTFYELAMQDPEWGPLVIEGEDDPDDVDPEIFEGKECDANEEVRWAWKHVFVRCIGPRDAPSGGAWTWLWDAKRSKEGMARLARASDSLLLKQAQLKKQQQIEADDKQLTEGLKKIHEAGLAVTEDGHEAPLGRIRPVLEQ